MLMPELDFELCVPQGRRRPVPEPGPVLALHRQLRIRIPETDVRDGPLLAARGSIDGPLRRRRASFLRIAVYSATPENRLALFEEGSHTLCIILAVVHHATQALHPFEALG